MDFKQIQELIRMLGKSDISEFKFEEENFKLSIRTNSYNSKAPVAMPQMVAAPLAPAPIAPAPVAAPAAVAPAPKAAEEPAVSNLVAVKSPMVGTFYRSAGPGKSAFVKIGDSIAVGNTVCIVEAMKLFNEIESEVSGKIVQILLEDASPVEYDQPLFLVDPKG